MKIFSKFKQKISHESFFYMQTKQEVHVHNIRFKRQINNYTFACKILQANCCCQPKARTVVTIEQRQTDGHSNV